MTKIFLDAGHGGKDSGAIGNGLYEKNVVLDIVKRIEKILKNEYKNVEVLLSRSSDTFLELTERTNKANNWGADCFVSIHNNAHNSTAKGFETFITSGYIQSETQAFQNVMHQEIVRELGSGIIDRGKKRAAFTVLTKSKMIAILTENLFLTSSSDAAKLKDSSFLDKIARGHVTGLEKFFGLEKVERTIRPPTEDKPKEDSGELFQVICGTFGEYSNAERRVKELKKSGYNSYINQK